MAEGATKGTVTRLLLAWRDGQAGALDELMNRVHPELVAIAARQLRGDTNRTLEPAALVNEVYLRLLGGVTTDFADRRHFFAIASRLCRQVLVDQARARYAQKRTAAMLPFGSIAAAPRFEEMLALDEAMTRLGEAYPQQAEVVELRFFGGLTIAEVAEHLGVGTATVERAWAFARAWLYRELSKS